MARERPPGPKPYSKSLADAVLTHIAGGGSMAEIYRNPDLPCRKTIYSWKTKHKDFRDALEEAKFAKADAIAEEALGAARNLYVLATQCPACKGTGFARSAHKLLQRTGSKDEYDQTEGVVVDVEKTAPCAACLGTKINQDTKAVASSTKVYLEELARQRAHILPQVYSDRIKHEPEQRGGIVTINLNLVPGQSVEIQGTGVRDITPPEELTS